MALPLSEYFEAAAEQHSRYRCLTDKHALCCSLKVCGYIYASIRPKLPAGRAPCKQLGETALSKQECFFVRTPARSRLKPAHPCLLTESLSTHCLDRARGEKRTPLHRVLLMIEILHDLSADSFVGLQVTLPRTLNLNFGAGDRSCRISITCGNHFCNVSRAILKLWGAGKFTWRRKSMQDFSHQPSKVNRFTCNVGAPCQSQSKPPTDC